jgi:7-cyano-7-deazaguanine synthase
MVYKAKAISILSGGLDSTVATAYLKDKYHIHAITFNYGQRSSEREIESSKDITKEMGMDHTVIDLPWLKNLGSSSLTSEEEIPTLKIADLDDKDVCNETARKVWVPGRNLLFTAIATSFAEASGAQAIITGWDHEEAVTFPDNSKEFLGAYNQLLKVGSIYDISIEAPLIDMDKKEIVQLGYGINAPLNLTYSCYQGYNEHCGICESCLRRERAFIEAGLGINDINSKND